VFTTFVYVRLGVYFHVKMQIPSSFFVKTCYFEIKFLKLKFFRFRSTFVDFMNNNSTKPKFISILFHLLNKSK